ncbi:MAG: ftsK [Candidatus Taylorbacteria bacterium]|nr:ftsK [Candidatus Taylorbacteria bacterium]
MAQKNTEKNRQKKQDAIVKKMSFWKEIQRETWQAVFSIFFFVFALVSVLSAAPIDKAGIFGKYFYLGGHKLLGVGYYLLPIFLVLIAIEFLKGIKKDFQVAKAVGATVFFLSALGLIDLFLRHAGGAYDGGVFGYVIAAPLIKIFDVYAATTILLALLAISLLVIFEAHFTVEHLKFWKLFTKDKETDEEAAASKLKAAQKVSENAEDEKINQAIASASMGADEEPEEGTPEAEARAAGDEKKPEDKEAAKRASPIKRGEELKFTNEEETSFASYTSRHSLKTFVPPPLSLLEKDKGKPEVGDIKANANIIKRTLQNFGITVEMDEVSVGPSVTRYALKPAEGVKLSKIVGLGNDLALALAAHPIRIEAPIPGKSLVGIEIPNTTKTMVGLATALASEEYQESSKPLLVSIGKGITGKSYFANLAKAPHMLIAGATGSGKSVTIHTLITSLLFRNSPESLKFIMIDPKRVELTLYNKIPHLLTPVITDPKKAILALKWAGKEMQRRYDTLETSAVRDIESYHTNIVAPQLEKARKIVEKHGGDEEAAQAEIAELKLPESMPYIVVVIDELADIMQTYPRELESAIVRLAQMSRAVGIHLILSTQRPSVNVITGLIKANVPTRVALQVASQIDSRTILDAAGAEKLLGAGDTLYQGGEMSKPVRLQSAYISEGELKKVVQCLHEQYRNEIMAEINFSNAPEAGSDAVFGASFDDDMGDEDEMYEQAKETVLSTGKASTSFLQRKLGVGYSRAAKLLDSLESRGVVGPQNGSKPREVFGASAPSIGGESNLAE